MLSLTNTGTSHSTRKSVGRPTKMLAYCVFAALLFAGASSAAWADGGCRRLVGAYLLTVKDSNGNFASRQVLTLSSDGNAFVVDSGQGGVPNSVNPFTSEQGSWDCQPDFPASATAMLLDFSLPGSVAGGQTIGRADYEISSVPAAKTISGTIELRFFPLTGNPLVTPLLNPPDLSFTFTRNSVK